MAKLFSFQYLGPKKDEEFLYALALAFLSEKLLIPDGLSLRLDGGITLVVNQLRQHKEGNPDSQNLAGDLWLADILKSSSAEVLDVAKAGDQGKVLDPKKVTVVKRGKEYFVCLEVEKNIPERFKKIRFLQAVEDVSIEAFLESPAPAAASAASSTSSANSRSASPGGGGASSSEPDSPPPSPPAVNPADLAKLKETAQSTLGQAKDLDDSDSDVVELKRQLTEVNKAAQVEPFNALDAVNLAVAAAKSAHALKNKLGVKGADPASVVAALAFTMADEAVKIAAKLGTPISAETNFSLIEIAKVFEKAQEAAQAARKAKETAEVRASSLLAEAQDAKNAAVTAAKEATEIFATMSPDQDAAELGQKLAKIKAKEDTKIEKSAETVNRASAEIERCEKALAELKKTAPESGTVSAAISQTEATKAPTEQALAALTKTIANAQAMFDAKAAAGAGASKDAEIEAKKQVLEQAKRDIAEAVARLEAAAKNPKSLHGLNSPANKVNAIIIQAKEVLAEAGIISRLVRDAKAAKDIIMAASPSGSSPSAALQSAQADIANLDSDLAVVERKAVEAAAAAKQNVTSNFLDKLKAKAIEGIAKIVELAAAILVDPKAPDRNDKLAEAKKALESLQFKLQRVQEFLDAAEAEAKNPPENDEIKQAIADAKAAVEGEVAKLAALAEKIKEAERETPIVLSDAKIEELLRLILKGLELTFAI